MGVMGLMILGGTAFAVLLVGVLVALLVRERRSTSRVLADRRRETDLLITRLDSLTAELAAVARTRSHEEGRASFVITDAGAQPREVAVPDRLVLSASVGEPLIKVAALAHGIRRALGPESRNRIFFEMRREVRRSRKQRRRDVREALRRIQSDQRAQDAA